MAYKLGSDVLVKIMSIFHDGILNQKDVSQDFRDLRLTLSPEGAGDVLVLAPVSDDPDKF